MVFRKQFPKSASNQISTLEGLCPIRRLGVQALRGDGTSWSVVSISSHIIAVFRGAGVDQGVVSCRNGEELKASRIYVRTTICAAGGNTLPGGIYLTGFRSLAQVKKLFPPDVFLAVNPNTLVNQNFLLGANVFEAKGKRRLLVIHDDRSLLPVRLLVTKGYVKHVKAMLGLPLRCRSKS